VILIDEGRVVATGSHAELMASTPLYSEVLARTALDADTLDDDEVEAS
jgi:ATP-binding cassette subfamily B protein